MLGLCGMTVECSNPQGQPILIFDCPFDFRRVSSVHWELPDLDQPLKTRMLILVHGIDGGGILRSLRGVTLSPKLTGNFLAAVMDQVASITPSQPAIERWQQLDPHLLLRMTWMSDCGRSGDERSPCEQAIVQVHLTTGSWTDHLHQALVTGLQYSLRHQRRIVASLPDHKTRSRPSDNAGYFAVLQSARVWMPGS